MMIEAPSPENRLDTSFGARGIVASLTSLTIRGWFALLRLYSETEGPVDVIVILKFRAVIALADMSDVDAMKEKQPVDDNDSLEKVMLAGHTSSTVATVVTRAVDTLP